VNEYVKLLLARGTAVHVRAPWGDWPVWVGTEILPVAMKDVERGTTRLL